jgi:GT2 family glycosyltransferase
VDGKFFRRGAEKFHAKGVAYGPFAPNERGEHFPTPERTERDFALIRELGANLLRVYNIPPRWLLDLAARVGLLVLIDIPWDKHLCFLDSRTERSAAREAVRQAVSACDRHPAVFAYSVANEIPADIVRWSGERAVSEFIDELVAVARRVDPECLCTFGNFPPTEFLRPQSLDFDCFNVYLHDMEPFKNYLARLQIMAEARPLVLGEFGIDSLREGEERKCEILSWQIESAFRGGVAGVVVFSFTDDWYRAGQQVDDWQMGLTTTDRQPKESFRAVSRQFCAAPYFQLEMSPRVSVVVASYNGDRTLSACLESLENLRYPDYEIILVDDGSTDTSQHIASLHPKAICVRHERNLGLSNARNTGITAATGEIIAFTDADCRVDEDWLYYLVGDLISSGFAGMGGPNLLPPDDSAVAAAVMVSPGGPAHVMLDDHQAEHVPGCNMAFYRRALEAIGGFDVIFTKAGDDVDVCWRMQEAGFKIGFSPAAFVWHYRRSTTGAYLKQQRGYGEAEALLVRKHPEYFNAFGGSIWRGRIYAASKFGVLLQPAVIYRGMFGTGMFQSIYSSQPALTLMLFTSLEYHLLVTLPLWVVASVVHYLVPVAIASVVIPAVVCSAAGAQAEIPKSRKRWWSRPLVALLFFLQPVVRGWARRVGRLQLFANGDAARTTFESATLMDSTESLDEVRYWAQQRVDRARFVAHVVEELDRRGWQHRTDIGWSAFDVELHGNRWRKLQLTTVAEDHAAGQMIRCRLQTRWTLLAKTVFWLLLGLGLLATGFLRTWSNWVCLLLLTLPLFVWYVHHQKRMVQSVVAVFLDELAKGRELTKFKLNA